jgi:hypothetical protein
MNKRLKLYDTSIEVILSSKLKKETKKIAFINNMTMSAYIRMLIKMGNEVYKNKKIYNDLKMSNENLKNIMGGIMNN